MTEIDMQLATIADLIAELDSFAPAALAACPVGLWRTEAEITAFEERLGVRLPDNYRGYLTTIGDGGFGFATDRRGGGGLLALADHDELDRAALPFVLHGPWLDPTDEAMARGLERYEEYAPRFYPLPDGARPTDGCLALGATPDHNAYQLVLAGPFAGTVWIDSTGYDLGGMTPAQPSDFLDLTLEWLRGEVDRARQEAQARSADPAELAARLAAAGPDERAALLEAIHTERADLQDVLTGQREVDPAGAARLVALARAAGDDLRISQALLVAGDWTQLRAHERAVLATLAPQAGAGNAVRTHLVLAAVRLGDDPAEAELAFGEDASYYSPSRKPVLHALAGCDDAELRRLVDLLPAHLMMGLLLDVRPDRPAALAQALERLERAARADEVAPGNAYADARDAVRAVERRPELAPAAETAHRVFAAIDGMRKTPIGLPFQL